MQFVFTFLGVIWFIVLTIIIPLLSLVLGALYWLTLVGPILDRFYPHPNPLIFLMKVYTGAVWHICFRGIMQMEMVVVDVDRPQLKVYSLNPQPKKLHVLLGNHPGNETLFPYIFYEMSQGGHSWLNIAVKFTQMFYPHGVPGLICACFTYVIRNGGKHGKAYSTRIIQRTIRRAIERGVTFMIFGDGTRFTEEKLFDALFSEKKWLRDAAILLEHVMPPRVTGMKSILEAAADSGARVVIHPRAVCVDTGATLRRPWTLFQKRIYIFRFAPVSDMTPANVEDRMTVLWTQFDRICADPARYVQNPPLVRSSKIA